MKKTNKLLRSSSEKKGVRQKSLSNELQVMMDVNNGLQQKINALENELFMRKEDLKLTKLKAKEFK